MANTIIRWTELDEIWRERHLQARLDEFERLLNAASGEGDDSQEKFWRLARLEHFRAMQADVEGESSDARHHFEQGKIWAEQSVEHAPFRVESVFWRGVNMLEAGRHSNPAALWRALSVAQGDIQRAEATDETYHFAGPLRVSGRITHRKPLLMGGSVEMSLRFFRRALQIAPHNSTTLLYYAEALFDDQQRRAARRVLQSIVDAPDDLDWCWEQERDRQLASKLLDKTEKE